MQSLKSLALATLNSMILFKVVFLGRKIGVGTLKVALKS